MDFSTTAEQLTLVDTARAWLSRDNIADAEAVWSQLHRLGWLDPGLGVVDLALLAQASVTDLLSAPTDDPSRLAGWWPTMALAAPAYRAAGSWPHRRATLAWAESPGPGGLASSARRPTCRADGAGPTIRLYGTKCHVVGAFADAVVTAVGRDGPALYQVDLAGNPEIVREVSTLDLSRPVARLRFDGIAATQLVDARRAPGVLLETRRRALTLLAAEAVGVARAALDLASTHARVRTQFGRPIGGFQGVSHRLADAAATVELAYSLMLRCAWCVESAAADADEAVAMATIAAREAALGTCAVAVQTLGGTGFTWAHPAHRLYRRARWIAGFDGPVTAYRAELATILLDRSGEPSVPEADLLV